MPSRPRIARCCGSGLHDYAAVADTLSRSLPDREAVAQMPTGRAFWNDSTAMNAGQTSRLLDKYSACLHKCEGSKKMMIISLCDCLPPVLSAGVDRRRNEGWSLGLGA